MSFVATGSMDEVDNLIKSPTPPAEKMIQLIGHENGRMLLQLMAGEENRYYDNTWEKVEIVLGVLLTAVLFLGVRNVWLGTISAAMLGLVLFSHFRITSDLSWLGRSVAFVPWNVRSLLRDQYWKLVGIHQGIAVVKLLLGSVIAGLLFAVRRRRPVRHRKVNAVDHADHSHIDR
jgi:hypothetical protein